MLATNFRCDSHMWVFFFVLLYFFPLILVFFFFFYFSAIELKGKKTKFCFLDPSYFVC